jgi:hypothetical protein
MIGLTTSKRQERSRRGEKAFKERKNVNKMALISVHWALKSSHSNFLKGLAHPSAAAKCHETVSDPIGKG